MNFLLDLLWQSNFGLILLISLISIFYTSLVNWFFRLNVVNGLLLVQVALYFNFVPFALLLANGNKINSPVYFIVIEILGYLLVAYLYKKSLYTLLVIIPALKQFRILFTWRFIIYLLALIQVYSNYFNAFSGGSRISFMLSSNYVYFKFFFVLIAVVSSSLLFFDFVQNNNFLLIDLVFLALASIASGSKAGFVLGLLPTYLIISDAKSLNTLFPFCRFNSLITLKLPAVLPKSFKFKLIKLNYLRLFSFFVLLFGVFSAISVIGLVFNDLLNRFFLFGESGYLVLNNDLLPDPSRIAEGLSDFARLHRGWARLLGDQGALNDDTLFGFALTMTQNGGINSFTGPNSRISSYFIVNYTTPFLLFASIAMVILFTSLYIKSLAILERIILAKGNVSILLGTALYFLLSGYLQSITQDYYTLLQLLSYLVLFNIFAQFTRLVSSLNY